MVSLKGFQKAGIDIFGIFSIYGSALISIMTTIYFFLGFVFVLLFQIMIYYSVQNFFPSNTSPIIIISELVINHLIINFLGLLGLIYLLKNFKNYLKIFNQDYSPTEKELKNSILYLFVNVILFLVYAFLLVGFK